MADPTDHGIEWCRRCHAHQALTAHGGICPVCDPDRSQAAGVAARAQTAIDSIDNALTPPVQITETELVPQGRVYFVDESFLHEAAASIVTIPETGTYRIGIDIDIEQVEAMRAVLHRTIQAANTLAVTMHDIGVTIRRQDAMP